MTLHVFLLVWNWACHVLWLTFAPDHTGNGNHVVYGGNWAQATEYAHTIHGGVVAPQCDYPVTQCVH